MVRGKGLTCSNELKTFLAIGQQDPRNSFKSGEFFPPLVSRCSNYLIEITKTDAGEMKPTFHDDVLHKQTLPLRREN